VAVALNVEAEFVEEDEDAAQLAGGDEGVRRPAQGLGQADFVEAGGHVFGGAQGAYGFVENVLALRDLSPQEGQVAPALGQPGVGAGGFVGR